MKKLGIRFGLLRNRNFLLVSSIVLGMIVGRGAHRVQALTLPGLALAMTVSIVQVDAGAFRSLRNLARATLVSIFLNYVLLGGLTLLLARLWNPEQELWTGFVLSAAVPSGIAVIPFSFLLGGDTTLALLGSVGVYASALIIMPAMASALVGAASINPLRLVIVLVELVLAPLVLSRLIRASPLRAGVERWRGGVVNWAFALLMFAVVGINRDALLSQPTVLAFTLAIALAGNFGLGFVLEWAMQRLHVARTARVTYLLMASMKNTGLAAATALALFSERTSVPAAVISATNVFYLVWLGARWHKSD
jgi:BASS family bile acid:Na+ symporter